MRDTDWQSLLEAGRQAIGRGQAQAALAAMLRARELAPEQREVRYWLGNAFRLAGRPEDAEAMFRALLREAGADSEAAFALAFLLRDQGRPGAAAEALLALANETRDDVASLLRITGFLRDSNRFEEAIGVLRMAIRLQPGDSGLCFRLARLYQATGRFDDALEQLRSVVASGSGPGGAWLSLAHLQRFTNPDSEDFRRLLAAAERPRDAEAEMCVEFALGKAYDDLGEWHHAWRHYQRGNALRQAMAPWDRASWRRQCDALLARPVRAPAPPAAPVRHPVYIVGMLRSGTTLLEQLLDRHPRITGRGELNVLAHEAAAAAADAPPPSVSAQTLWTHLRLDGPEDGWYVDKNPLNFRHLGLLAEVLPEARIIQVTRDGRDACLSCYFQLFQHPDAGFANDLDDLLDFYRGYRRLMAHWQAVLGDRIQTVAYETLVASPRPTLERVLRHLGLEWDDRMEADAESPRPVRTASTWQARQPIHRGSIGRWEKYRDFAPDFFDTLRKLDRD